MISAISLAVLTMASAQSLQLFVESADSNLSNKGLSSIHFGAGANGVLIGDEPETFQLNSTSSQVYLNITISDGLVEPLVFNEFFNTLEASAGDFASNIKLENHYLTINGSANSFYACSPLAWDPYGYTANGSYGVGIYAQDAPATCKPIKVRASDNSTTSTPPASYGNSTVTTSPAAPPAGAHNGTTVTAVSTAYTTIDCSTPTTLTYGSQTFTVTSSTKITVEDCSCTQSPASSTPASSTPASGPVVASSATHAASTTPVLSNGAASLKLSGVFGIAAGAAALML